MQVGQGKVWEDVQYMDGRSEALSDTELFEGMVPKIV